MTEPRRIVVKNIPQPDCWLDVPSVPLTDATLKKRKARVLARMAQLSLETLIVYADKEHGANFEYLTGFIPRFEEALLVLHQDGEAVLVLGNENLKLAAHARLENRVMHAPWFSLPNQPMTNAASLPDTLRLAGLADKKRIGVAGWKLFTSEYDDNSQLFDLPSFIVDSLRAAVTPDCVLTNATGVFISPANGARVINTANELAHYEYGANLASTAILQALNAIEPGKTEKQIGALLAAEGQANNVIMIAATGERFASANLYPSD
ncbi:aminopeptidase P family N-terminal domain-containing protein, partial [Atlantibacter subterraneus]|uniref:aminopeptidase P family N-terminal domain-containing protein n=1 Tax=Atlantibacter subterraneus TaxID=255519 RepID=UPI002FDCABEF